MLSPKQILALAVALQLIFVLGLLRKHIFAFGIAPKPHAKPRWLFAPLLLGTACGIWYGAEQSDLIFATAQALALALGLRAMRRPEGIEEAAPQKPESRLAKRLRAGKEAKK